MQAVIFDLDGVLIDSEHLWDEVRRDLAARAGRPWPEGATVAMQGVGTADWSAYLANIVGIPEEPVAIATHVIEAMGQRYAAGLPLLPGAVAAVERMASRWPLGLASGSPRLLIDKVMSASPLGKFFQVAVASDEVAANKPAPDVYLEVVRRLGAEPGQSVAVEDSVNGLRSAHAAGLVVVAVPQAEFTPPPETLALADVTLSSLDEFVPSLVEQLLVR